MPLHITPLYAALLTFIYLFLSARVIRLRRRHLIGLGYGELDELQRAVRIHGNFAEYVPLALLLLFFLEWGHWEAWVLHGLGILLLLGRLFHAYGLTLHSGKSHGRVLGMVCTFTMLITSAALCLYHVFFVANRVL